MWNRRKMKKLMSRFRLFYSYHPQLLSVTTRSSKSSLAFRYIPNQHRLGTKPNINFYIIV
jgi:hypothetical protein